MKHIRISLFLFLCLFLSGCCPIGKNCEPANSQVYAGDISITLLASQSWYPSNSVIKLKLSIQNHSQKTIDLQRLDGPVVDIVYSSDPTQRWSAQPDLAVDIHTLTLQPGETYSIEWEFLATRDDVYGFYGMLWIWEQESRTGLTVLVGNVDH
ncbi:MAG: hypothetical protein RMK99_15820 [Anaerolineales bacterium]|nr:hypothetical protein [Anaerolineales bacterium]